MVTGAILVLENTAITTQESSAVHMCITLQDVKDGLMRNVNVNAMTVPGTASKPCLSDVSDLLTSMMTKGWVWRD